MGDRTGLGPLEVGLLEVLDELGARPASRYVKTFRVLDLAVSRLGVGANYLGEVLRDLARPWRVMVRLVDFHGNIEADSRYNECRLSEVGALALAAERRELPAVPVGLINGTVYQGGSQPSFPPDRVIGALSELLRDREIGDQRLLAVLGSPVFPHGCRIVGDVGAALAGERTDLHLFPHIDTDWSANQVALDLTHFPPELWADDLARSLEQHAPGGERMERDFDFERLPIAEVMNVSAGLADHSNEHVRIVLEEDADPEDVIAKLIYSGDAVRYFWTRTPLRYDMTVAFRQPVTALLRSWIDTRREEDLNASLRALSEAIDTAPSPPARPPVRGIPLTKIPGGVPRLLNRSRTFPADLANQTLLDVIEPPHPVNLTYTAGDHLTGTASGVAIDSTISRAAGGGHGDGAIADQALRVEWHPTQNSDGYYLTLAGTLGDHLIHIDAALQPAPGRLFEHAEVHGTLAGEQLDVRVEGVSGGLGSSDTVAIDGTLGDHHLALYAALASSLTRGIIRGTINHHHPVHIDATAPPGKATIHITGTFPGPPNLLTALLAVLLAFM